MSQYPADGRQIYRGSDQDASATPKPRAGEHITERERVAERIVQALHADFTTYNKAKVMLLLQPLSGIWPEPWQTEMNKVAAERDLLRERERELVEALETILRAEFGAGMVVPRACESTYWGRARTLLSKHGR